MKKLLLSGSTAVLLLLATAAGAQTGVTIGAPTAPDASAALDIISTTKGVLLPRVASTAAVTSPAKGLLVYQTGNPAGFYYNAGTTDVPQWQQLNYVGGPSDNLGNHTATQALDLGTHVLTGTGTSVGTAVGVGVTAQGGLNIGQNAAGSNVFVGYQAGQATTAPTANSGNVNTFVGYQAGAANSTGSENIFMGYQAGLANTAGRQNMFIGNKAGTGTTTGNDNMFIGDYSGQLNSTGEGNLFIGYGSGFRNTTGNNQFVGFESGRDNTTGGVNQFAGYQSGHSNSTGSYNFFSGYDSGLNNTTASNNHFSGQTSGFRNTTGHSNLAVGLASSSRNQTGSYNTVLGDSAAYFNTASFNQALGYQAGYATTTGTLNTFVGYRAGYINTTGSLNSALGHNAGPSLPGLTNATALGYAAGVSQSNSLVLGGTGAYAVNVGIGTTAPSEALDVVGNLRLGASASPAAVYSPTTNGHNLLAVAYGQLGNNPLNIYATSDNYTAVRNGPGSYLITFTAASGLSSINFDDAVVVATLYGSPGFITWQGGPGSITISTTNTSGTAADRIFTFSVFNP